MNHSQHDHFNGKRPKENVNRTTGLCRHPKNFPFDKQTAKRAGSGAGMMMGGGFRGDLSFSLIDKWVNIDSAPPVTILINPAGVFSEKGKVGIPQKTTAQNVKNYQLPEEEEE